MNFVAVLAVLAATSFVLPLLVQGCQSLGLPRGISVALSLILAVGAMALWLARVLIARSPRSRGRARAALGRGGTMGVPSSGVAEGIGVRLLDTEEEHRARV